MSRTRFAVLACLAAALLAGPSRADQTDSLKKGDPDLKSAGPLAFGPDGILFVGDPQAAAVFAIDTGDRAKGTPGEYQIEGINEKVASLLGTDAKQVQIADLAVNPLSGKAYLSVARGRGPDAAPVLLRTDSSGKLQEVALEGVKFAKATLPNPAEGRRRQEAITDLAYVDGRLFIAGLSNEEFASKLRSIPFPFTGADPGASIEIYHGAHGRFETNSPVRTFAPFDIKGEPHLLAAYTCTPPVKMPVADLKAGSKVKGTTVAELGNRNRPLDMIVYQKDGKNYVLMANSSRGMMKIQTEGIDQVEAITNPVRGGGKAGLPYETIEPLKGVVQMDRLDKDRALVLLQTEGGSQDLKSVQLP